MARVLGLRVWLGGLVGLTLLTWIGFLLIGILVSSAPYREAIRGAKVGELGAALMGNAHIVFASYTVSNLLVLCVLASLLGALGRKVQLGPSDDDVPDDVTSPYLSAAIRGFFIYLAVMAGIIVMSDEALVNPRQEMYFRSAGFLSLLAFTASYNPSIFRSLFSWVGNRIPAGKQDDAAKLRVTAQVAVAEAPKGNGTAAPTVVATVSAPAGGATASQSIRSKEDASCLDG